MSAVTTFVEGDIVRTEDPDFELVYKKEKTGSEPGVGKTSVLDGSNELVIAGVATQTKKINVKTSLVDRETGNVGVLQRGYIVQKAGASTLNPDTFVKSDAAGLPIPGTPATDGILGKLYGIVIGKANTNDQTQRVPALTNELVIIKVGNS